MSRFFKIFLPICLLLFLMIHYFIMSISKELFPVFSYLYPFVSKFWFEASRLLLYFNLQLDIILLFKGVRYLLIGMIITTLFSFKYKLAYQIMLWSASLFTAVYIMCMLYLGLLLIYPFYIIILVIFLCSFIYLLLNKLNQYLLIA